MSSGKNKENYVTQSAFASLCGVSTEAVRKACTVGKIDFKGEGRQKRINVTGENSISYLNDRNSQRKDQGTVLPVLLSSPEGSKKGDQKKKSVSLPGQPGTSVIRMSDFESDDFDINSVSQNDIKKFKELETARRSAQERRKSRGQLIDRDLVKRFLGKLFTIEQNELKPIADKAPAKIAAIFQDEDSKKQIEVSKVLSKDITKALDHITRTTKKFIEDLGDNNHPVMND